MFRPLFSATVPNGWRIRSGLDYSEPDTGIRVTIFEEPVPVSFTTEHYCAAYGELLSQHFPGYEQLGPVGESDLLYGLSALARRLRWQPTGGAGQIQTQVYSVVDGRGIVATATAAETTYGQRTDDLDATLRFARVSDVRLRPVSPASAGGTATADRYDDGKILLDRGSAPAQDTEIVCALEELAAVAHGLGLPSYPGVADVVGELADDESARLLRGGRRSLRARGLVSVADGKATVLSELLTRAISAPFMLTSEWRSDDDSAKVVYFGSADGYVELLAIDAGLIRLSHRDKAEIVERIETDHARTTGTALTGRIAWLRRDGVRYTGAEVQWERDAAGTMTEAGTARGPAALSEIIPWLD